MEAIVSFIVDVVVVLQNIGDGLSILCVVAGSCSKLSLDFTMIWPAPAGVLLQHWEEFPDCARNCALFFAIDWPLSITPF